MISSAKMAAQLESAEGLGELEAVPAHDYLRSRAETRASTAEVCPLCLSRLGAVLECVCAGCEAPACPECAATIAGTNEVLCYACQVPTTH